MLYARCDDEAEAAFVLSSCQALAGAAAVSHWRAGARMITREEHLARCKQGAIARLEAGDPKGAVASMISDLRKSGEPLYDAALLRVLMTDALLYRNTPDQVRNWIEGFN
jgi:hypothetical protein